MSRVIKLFALITVLALSGCSSMSNSSNYERQMGNLLLPEPSPISAREQMKLMRLNQILNMQEMSAEQRAELLYIRGEVYDSFGLWGLAMNDFNTALEHKPDLAEVYNYLGIHYTQEQNFIQAFDAFDSTLDIDPEHSFAYLNRGIALYYAGRQKLAVEDLETFLKHREDDPYRVIWLFLAEREVDEKAALVHLAENRKHIQESEWAKHLVDLYLGEIDEIGVLNLLMESVTNQEMLTERLCEAYFYLGKYHMYNNRPNVASNYFRLALTTNVYNFVEHRYARLELDLMRKKTYEGH
ncbi:lipoprotein NlpI [Paraneptunicella aestuarii]|uniref:lipoprotein NlpI n=1 Tax=Paraneptunicella aestuarii TaxID=2831148 RepID=UPI001E36D81F|nr:lipoprotein NlpI [Paraneptunicella aestuarii]UAA39906.1 lipoprotein NlpI [Paraneptunicella aestuarii]